MPKKYFTGSCTAALALAALLALSSCDPPFDPDLAYPAFANEAVVAINGYSLDAMEPFISRDGQFLFFNSLNNGTTTSLYYATRVDATTFTYVGPVLGVNGTGDHLDAVASMDENSVFYWVSTRDWPDPRENYWRGSFAAGSVADPARVVGNFYINEGTWIIMDAEIDPLGSGLYYTNTLLTGTGGLSESRLGVATRNLDNSFTKMSASDSIMDNVTYSDHLVYAPSITSDGSELYFTRVRKGTDNTQICVALLQTDGFSLAKKLDIEGSFVEAPSISPDGERLYYHKKGADKLYHIYTMTRQ